MSDDWNPVHPDTVVGPENLLLVQMFGDINWENREQVEARVAELQALDES